MPPTEDLWQFMIVGYLITVAIELPVLLIGLSPVHAIKTRLAAGFWLTACSYPIVVIVLPILMHGHPRMNYLMVAETFAPASECLLFWLAFHDKAEHSRWHLWRDWAVIAVANLMSFLPIELLRVYGVIDW